MATSGPNQKISFSPEEQAKFKPLFVRFYSNDPKLKLSAQQIEKYLGPEQFEKFKYYIHFMKEALQGEKSKYNHAAQLIKERDNLREEERCLGKDITHLKDSIKNGKAEIKEYDRQIQASREQHVRAAVSKLSIKN